MLKQIRKHRSQASIEYIFVITLILVTFLIFQKYIARGFVGRWKGAGDSFGQGRQFDPNSTTQCAYDFRFTNSWYEVPCFEANCEDDCLSGVYFDNVACQSCISGCSNPVCVPAS